MIESNLFSEVNENFKPYAISGHRHSAEISEVLKLKNLNLNYSFIPHLLPITRNTSYFHTNLEYSNEFFEVMNDFYIDSPFVHVCLKDLLQN